MVDPFQFQPPTYQGQNHWRWARERLLWHATTVGIVVGSLVVGGVLVRVLVAWAG